MRKMFAPLVVLSGLPLSAAWAQSGPPEQIATSAGELADTSPAQAIIVTGQGLAASPGTTAYGVQEIDKDRLRQTASGRLEDALGQVAGFQQFRRSDSRSSNPSAQGVTLRALGGNATSRALVLLDGVPMADPFFGYIPFSAIDPARLARARVTRGGGTGAFGSGAVAGTIELESAGPDRIAPASASMMLNDRSETEMSASLAPQLGSGFAVANVRWDRGAGFWTTPPEQRRPASARARYESWSVGLRGVAPLTSDLELQLRGLVFDDHRTLRFAGADSFSSGQDASLRIVGRGPWQIDALAYVQARDFGNIVISANNFRKTLDQRRTPSTGYGGKIEVRPPLRPGHILRLGADLRVAEGEIQEDAYSTVSGLVTKRRRAGGRNGDIGLFAEHDWIMGPLVLTGGGRLDRWTIADGRFLETDALGVGAPELSADRSGWVGSFRGGAVLRVAEGIELRGAAYSGLRQPTLNELYRPFVVSPVTTFANDELRNETLRGFEAGLDIAPMRGVTFALTAFDNRVKDAIANVTIDREMQLRKRFNVDAVTSRGIELSGRGQWGSLDFNGSLALTDATVRASGVAEELDKKRPAQTPKIAAYAGLAWRPAPRWTVSASLRHTGAQFEDDLESNDLPPATTVDAFVELPLGPVSIVLRGENLFDTDVVTRKVGPSSDLGTPRTLWLGLRFGR